MHEKLKIFRDLNQEIRKCKRCRLWETRRHALPGEGDIHAKLMLIAQAPGYNEDREGRMFIGPSGKELNELLEEIDIKRKDIYMTNLIKCMLPKYRKPKEDEIEICSKHLDKEIELIKPRVIAPLGHYATKYALKKYGIPILPKPEFYEVYGRLFVGKNMKIFPLQHPAAVLYSKSIKKVVIKNYRKLKVLLTDCKWYPACPMKGFYEQGRLDKKWIELYCKGDWESCVRYQMEKEGKPHPDCMLPNGRVDERLKDIK